MRILLTFLFLIATSVKIHAQCEGFSQVVSGTDPTCFGFADGSVSTELTGGTEPYTIETRNEADELVYVGGEIVFTLPQGWYYSYVVDDAGCELYDSIYLSDPIPLSMAETSIVDPTSLEACDGSITIGEVLGDFGTLTYLWSPDPDGISGIDAAIFPDACVGTYELAVMNEFGCATVGSFDVGIELSLLSETAPEIDVLVNANDVYIGIPTEFVNSKVTFYELSGRLVYSQILANNDNHIQFEAEGVLMYSIVLNDVILKNGKVILC
jgi:hypothetical protein